MQQRFSPRFHRISFFNIAGALAYLALVGALQAQIPGDPQLNDVDPVQEMEFKFAEALIDAGMPDYAKIVLDRIPKTGENQIRMEVLEVRGMIALGQFEAVRQIIARRPDQTSPGTWAMKLALADGHFAWGQFKDARTLYAQFFKAYPDAPPEALNTFFRDSAYKYAQMLLLIGEEREAIKAYQTVLKAQLEDHVKRQITTETAELMVKVAESLPADARKKMIPTIEKLLDSVLYGGIDLWFGKAMALTAHLRLMEGDVEGAMFILESNWDQLVELDGILRHDELESGNNLTRFSPLAHARYMLGDMLLTEAKKIKPWPPTGDNRVKAFELLAESRDSRGQRKDGAFRHFLNVFYQYPSSQWAPEAGEKAEVVKRMIEEDIKPRVFDVTIDPKRIAAVEREQFQIARVLYNQQQFAQAADAYIRVLNIFPETETAVAALGELALCYIEIPLVGTVDDATRNESELMVEMLVGYISERFNKNPDLTTLAGDRALRIAGKYDELGQRNKRDAVYNVFFSFFTEHPRTPALLYTVAQEKLDANDLDGALAYFSQISTNYPGNRVYFPSLSRIAQIHNRREDVAQEMTTLQKLVDELEKETAPGHLLASALYRLAFAHRSMGLQLLRADTEDEPEAETDADPAKDPKAEGEKHILVAIDRYTKLREMLTGEDAGRFQSSAEEAENNRRMTEGCLFYIGFCQSLLTQPPERVPEYRRQAIAMYENLLKRHPRSQFAPLAYSQIGTLWTILEEPEKAREALHRLQKEHPDSAEARNALFMLGMNLLELNMRAEAVKVFSEMFRSSGQYTPLQILTAGNELNKAGQYEIALQAFNQIISGLQTGTSMHEMAVLGRGQALLETGDFGEAIKMLEMITTLYPNSRSIVPASIFLSRAYAETAMRESHAARRQDLFNEAVRLLNEARKYDKTRVDRAKSNLAVANIFSLRVKAEEKFGTPASVKQNIPRAIVPLLTMIIGAQFDNPEELPFIEEAFYRITPLFMQDERWLDAFQQAEAYIKRFPRGRYLSEIRQWRGQAETRMVMLGISRDTDAPAMQYVPGDEDIEDHVDDGTENEEEAVPEGTVKSSMKSMKTAYDHQAD